jgi:hypothetical protein
MLTNEACAVWKKGKSMLDTCQILAANSLGASVSYLEKMGSLTDLDRQQTEHTIDRVLFSRCKPRDKVVNEKHRE